MGGEEGGRVISCLALHRQKNAKIFDPIVDVPAPMRYIRVISNAHNGAAQ